MIQWSFIHNHDEGKNNFPAGFDDSSKEKKMSLKTEGKGM
jgi:hypothetical protein